MLSSSCLLIVNGYILVRKIEAKEFIKYEIDYVYELCAVFVTHY